MKYLFESLEEFICNLNRSKEPVIEKQTDPELMAELEDEIKDQSAECPRCGKMENKCICQERDAFSTINAFRMAKGKKYDKKSFK